ncbi:hypothetical protein CANINC_000379 [Pichia inconspicua]|uniref:Uncharacterized protein n=1 Tax=Pichia inconspicua TaxID=52247 RepID=A0A4T0X6A7_9ASCO|nr:hypothetical protein CANINC_000379 [[Candida] inconspicua]
MPRYASSTDKKHTSTTLPYPSTGILSRLKGFFSKDKPTATSTTPTTPTTTPAPASSAPSAQSARTAPSFIAPPDISTVSNLSTRNPNDTLSEFFNRKGDEPLSEIEVEGVLSLIRKAQSQSRTASANHSLLSSFDVGNNTTTVLRRASSHLPKPVTVPTPTFKSRVKTQPSSRSTSFTSTSFSGAGVSKRRIISYNTLDAPFNIKHRGLKSFIERKKREVENKDTSKTTIYKGGKIDLNFEDTPEPTPVTNSKLNISSTANSVLTVLNELEQSKEEKEEKEKEEKEKEQKEKEQKEKEQKEKEQKEKEQKEKEQKEKEQKEKEQKEKELKEKELKEKALKEKEQKENEQKEIEQKEKEKQKIIQQMQERNRKEEEESMKQRKEEEKVKFLMTEHSDNTSPIVEEKSLFKKDMQTATQSIKNPISSFTFSGNKTSQTSPSKKESTTTVEVIESFVFPQVSPEKPISVQNQDQHSTQISPEIFNFPEVPPASPALIQQIASLKDDYKDVFTF